jgi:hypothetical protein
VFLVASLVLLTLALLPFPALAWNIPGHMPTRSFSPQSTEKVKAVLEKHPWYANQWQARLQDVPVADRDMLLLMQAARWPDDIRIQDKPKIDRLGITSTCHLNPMANRRTCKSETPSR